MNKDYDFPDVLKVEIAETPSRIYQGLMFRKSMSYDSGMVFIFKYPQKLKFWGRNTYIPLDIAFIDKDMKISQISDIKALDDKEISSQKQCGMAIEANLGYFAENNIGVGSIVELRRQPYHGSVIIFNRKGGQSESKT